MKKARDEETFRTIPDGCYECGSLSEEKEDKKEMHDRLLVTDLQGNGYPVECPAGHPTEFAAEYPAECPVGNPAKE